MTPVFSYLLSRLLFEVSKGGTNTKVINQFGGILVVCSFDGIFMGVMVEVVSMRWKMSVCVLERVLAQDKAWFDGGYSSSGETSSTHPHSTQSVIQTLTNNGDDARALVSIVYGQTFVVVTMLSTGLISALILGWRLTLAGLGIAPVFAVVMAL